ncbi:MAG: SpoIIE family protein phosphatase [Candidatus Eisenbacteria bacterium]|uniref:SpoIIE family protein phosphatase n=1 Tax=Eiseniibacteriota bacterium TaxID=2212470 RepID=A0A948W5Y5_UNCEI|nr:SpoIIE family protein phosphatase [Candidatus Eisenbacteria bacterium]MBU1951027.1 SpoIIE family protein phosphatase [Candidatus Eisenbacteria bacterium]MBU2690056.1 SpoIIE family protein phosphatase [Candidatus Eisenbacteria bacterium]
MTAYLFHLLGLSIALAWYRYRSRPKLSGLLILWCIGIITCRVGPILVGFIYGSAERTIGPFALNLVLVTGWVGSIILLHVILSLTLWRRQQNRRFWVWAALFIAALLIAGFGRKLYPLVVILAIPWLWALRWREGLGARALTLVSFVSFISLLLCGYSIGVDGKIFPSDIALSIFQFQSFASTMALIYAALTLPRTANRIHLSIRRIRNRLLVSHLLAGVVPVVLVALFLLLSGALFLSTYRGLIATKLITQSSEAAVERLSATLSESGEIASHPFGMGVRSQMVLIQEGDNPAYSLGKTPAFPPDSLLGIDSPSADTPLLWDGQALYLRARVDTVYNGHPFRIEALTIVDSLHMARVSDLLGIPVRISPSLRVLRNAGGVTIDSNTGVNTSPAIGPGQPDWKQLPGGAIIHCLQWNNHQWDRTAIPVLSSATLGESLMALISAGESNPLAIAILIILGILAVLVLGASWITTTMVYGMGRSIARSVRSLTEATRELSKGNLSHRIFVEDQDELWSVASSFNTMARGLERGRSMELEQQRYNEELKLAYDIQKRLLPRSAPQLDGLELAGLSLSAREIGGDYFDYIELDDGRLGVVVADVAGKGVPAALLMSSFRASLRSQDLCRQGPAETMGRLNRFIYSSVDPGRFITVFLAIIDPAAGNLRYAQAGHEPPILVDSKGSIETLTTAGLVLGLKPRIEYEEAGVDLPRDSLLTIFTDGVTEAQSPDGDFFGEMRLHRLLQNCNKEPCDDLLRRIMAELSSYSGPSTQSDDITVVLARRT